MAARGHISKVPVHGLTTLSYMVLYWVVYWHFHQLCQLTWKTSGAPVSMLYFNVTLIFTFRVKINVWGSNSYSHRHNRSS